MQVKTTRPDILEVEVTCIMCKKVHSIEVPRDGYRRWLNGEAIQRAMPKVPVEQRELLISNTCGTCFDNMFAEE